MSSNRMTEAVTNNSSDAPKDHRVLIKKGLESADPEKKVEIIPFEQKFSTTTSRKLFTLKQEKIKTAQTTSKVNNEKEVLLLNAYKPTDEYYNKLGIPSKKAFVNKALKDINAIKKYEDMFKGCDAYKGKYIKELANKLYLQILPLNSLHAILNEETVEFIMKFHKKFDVQLSDSCFYILAPKEYFKPEFDDKEASTYIIFFRSPKDSSNDKYATIDEEDTIVQLYSSGDDFASNRKWIKYVNTESTNDTISKRSSNIVFGICLLFWLCMFPFVIIPVYVIILAILLLIIFVDNTTFKSYEYWNKKVYEST
tara:strand:+ start:5876 stop:6808 length:933 start_codon:yes stop_codon:yes gene_type:complete